MKLRVLATKRLLFTTLFVMLCTLLTSASKIAPDLQKSDPNSTVDVIVQFTHTPTPGHFAKVAAKGGLLKNKLTVIKGGLFSIRAAALVDLAADPDILYVSPDRPVTAFLSNAAPAVNANVAWNYGYDGTGIGVAVIDSGIAPVDDLQDALKHTRIVYSQDFSTSPGTVDLYGHGTQVAGIIAGDGQDSKGLYKGIAPNANLINLRVLDASGQGKDSAVVSAIDAAIQFKSKYNIRVLNLSLGRPVFESYKADPLCQAVESAWKAGIVVVGAAGNDGRNNSAGTAGYGTISSPANDPYIITVGAMKTMSTPTRSDDLIASYSSKGPTLIDHIVKPDLVAPGNRIVSANTKGASQLNQNYPQNVVQKTYITLSGTSMATAPSVRCWFASGIPRLQPKAASRRNTAARKCGVIFPSSWESGCPR